MDLNLRDKVVLVTGGTGGIGTAIVKGFLAEGAKVAFSSTRQEKIDALLPQLGAAEGQVAGFVADMSKEEDIKNFVDNAKAAFGTIDIVVPNAGYEGKAHPVQDMTLDLFEQTYMLNVFSVMLLMKYAAPTLIEKQSGAVVVVASAAAYEPTAGNSAYVSSKYAVAGLTKCVAMELGFNESMRLLRMSPFRLQENSPIDAMYLLILKYEGKYSVREWNKVLLDMGEKPLSSLRKPGDNN